MNYERYCNIVMNTRDGLLAAAERCECFIVDGRPDWPGGQADLSVLLADLEVEIKEDLQSIKVFG